VLLAGGVFDPPHRAHVAMPVAARDSIMGPGAWLVLVPAARSPLKAAGPRVADADRLAMLRLAIKDEERAAIWTDEVDRAGAGANPSYWIETLERARRALGHSVTLRFAIGSDQAADFHRWHRPREVLGLAAPIVLLREPLATAEAVLGALRASGFWSASELVAWQRWIWPGAVMAGSATDARAAATRGDDTVLVRLVGPAVLRYIRERGLYR
jgi:nicotinate (nicotinamide) nucleotide adenylyltransferase